MEVEDKTESSPNTDVENQETIPDEPHEDSADDEKGSFMPDPQMMLSFASMQMDVHGFAGALIPLFDSYAWQSMGLVANVKTGELTKNLAAAQFAIDSVHFLLTKLESTMPSDQVREAQRRLTDLRMNYLTQSRM